jgi:aminoglycoside phosphotransferase (APT) family kinase protein
MRNETDIRLRAVAAHSGWCHLLPARSGQRVLCVDRGDGHATLAVSRRYREVVAVPLDPDDRETIADLVRFAGLHNVEVLPDLEQARDQAPFEGLVAMLVGASRPHGGAEPREHLLQRASQLVAGGFVFLGFSNSHSYQIRRPREAYAGRRSQLAAIAKGEERPHLRAWPTILHDGEVHEVLHRTSRLPRQSGGGEALKHFLHRRPLRSVMAPGYLILAQKEPVQTEVAAILHAAGTSSEALERHLVLDNKTVLVTGDSPSRKASAVVVPFDAVGRSRRSREAGILELAGRLPLSLRQLFPQPMGAGEHDGQAWFAMSRIAGTFPDRTSANLDRFTAAAAEKLLQLHLHTARETRIDRATYERLTGELFGTAMQRHPRFAASLQALDRALCRRLEGRTLPLVWMHGDYKIENVAFDSRTGAPVGIIDWELGRVDGYPLVDLGYLLGYNRMLRCKQPFSEAGVAVLRERSTGAEKTLWNRYVEAMALPPDLLQPLAALAIVHAVGERLHFDLADGASRRQFASLLRAADEFALAPDELPLGDAA